MSTYHVRTRREMVAGREIPDLKERISKDGKTYRQERAVWSGPGQAGKVYPADLKGITQDAGAGAIPKNEAACSFVARLR